MPHDLHGRLIEVGSIVMARPYNQPEGFKNNPRIGVVTSMNEGSPQSCTGQMDYLDNQIPEGSTETSNLKGCLVNDYFGAEDAILLQKPNGGALSREIDPVQIQK